MRGFYYYNIYMRNDSGKRRISKFVSILSLAAVFVVCFASIFGFSISVPDGVSQANSALMYQIGDINGYELLPVYDDELSIAYENLTFDFSQYNKTDKKNLYGNVTARYDINNAGGDKNVTIGFPLYSSIEALQKYSQTVSVNVNNESVEPEILLLNDYKINNSFLSDLTFEKVLEIYNDMEYADKNSVMQKFSFDFSALEEGDSVRITFNLKKYFSVVYYQDTVYQNYNNVENGRSYYEIDVEVDADKTFVLYVDGNEIEMPKAYLFNGDGEKDTQLNSVSESAVAIDAFINENNPEAANNPSVYNLYLHYINFYRDSDTYRPLQSLQSFFQSVLSSQRVIIVKFDVNFKPGANVMSVSYVLDTGINYQYKPEAYLCDYISEPAKNWHGFGGVTIKVITNKTTPYVIFGNIDFEKTGDYEYSFVSTELPDYNISFSLCSSKDPSDRYGFQNALFYIVPIIIIAAMVLVIFGLVILVLYLVDKKNKKKAQIKKQS